MKNKIKYFFKVAYAITWLASILLLLILISIMLNGDKSTERIIYFGVLWTVLFIYVTVSPFVLKRLNINIDNLLDAKKSKPREYTATFHDYSSLYTKFKAALLNLQYEELSFSICEKNSLITPFVKHKPLGFVECVVIARLTEFNMSIYEDIWNKTYSSLADYLNVEVIRDRVRIINILCVDEYSSNIESFLESTDHHGFKLFRLPVVIALNEKRIYVNQQNDLYAIGQHKRLKKEFKLLAENANIDIANYGV